MLTDNIFVEANMQLCTCVWKETCKHANVSMMVWYQCVGVHAHKHSHTLMHACTHAHTHACTHARTHAHTRDLTTNPPLRSIQPLVKHKLGSEEYKVSGNVSGPGGGKSSEIACQTILPVYHLDNIPTHPVHAGSFNDKYVQ